MQVGRRGRGDRGSQRLDLLFEPLLAVEVGVEAVARQQRGVVAELDDAAVVEDGDAGRRP